MFWTSCVSTTTIEAVSSGAKLYLNGESVGVTPYTHQDARFVRSRNYLKVEKEGYTTLNTSFSRDEEFDVGAVVGGFFH
ncbi:MAG: PEGA domain-containing protein [Saprospiraceae bacterium]